MHDTGLTGLNGEAIVYREEEIAELISSVAQEIRNLDTDKIDKDTLLIEAFNSATIEGARTTIENVKSSINNPVSKSDKMVVNDLLAQAEVYRSGYEITTDNIRSLWETVVKDVCENESKKGEKYRNGMVYVSSIIEIIHIPAEANEIEKYMGQLFRYMNSNENTVIKACIVHFYFVYIHPFCDGNGRMSRLLHNYILYKGGLSNVRAISISEQILLRIGQYSKILHKCEKPTKVDGVNVIDITSFIEYMCRVILEAVRKSKTRCIEFTDDEKIILSKMRKKGLGAEITVIKVSGILGTNEDKSRRVLNSLVDKGVLAKRRVGKRNIYTLKIV